MDAIGWYPRPGEPRSSDYTLLTFTIDQETHEESAPSANSSRFIEPLQIPEAE
jgi:hypothetical protein